MLNSCIVRLNTCVTTSYLEVTDMEYERLWIRLTAMRYMLVYGLSAQTTQSLIDFYDSQ